LIKQTTAETLLDSIHAWLNKQQLKHYWTVYMLD